MTVQKGGWDYFDESFAETALSNYAQRILAKDTSTWNWPNTVTQAGSATQGATAVDDTEIVELSNVTWADYFIFENASTTDGVTLQISLDGTNYSGDIAVKLHDATASATHVVSIPAGDFGIFEGKCSSIKALKNGTTNEAPGVRYLLGVK